MLTPRVFVRVLILILFEFFFGCRCAEPPNQLKRCYDVGYNTFCFFRPDSGYKRMTWAKAYQTCRRNNATLPTIPSEAAQAAFEEYLKFLKLVFDYDCWMAGQEVREREWKWLNDRTSNLTVRQLTGNTSSDYVQGVLQHDMSYRTDTPSHINHFICQLKGMACRSNRTIPLGKDCILADITEALNLYDARNKCVKEGGDLLEIDNSGDLDILREIITRIPNVNKVWIGLRRQWWAWNATEYFFRCQCADPPHHQKECYEVGYNTFCFFRPEHEYMFLTWQDAYQTCLRSNAMSTLPAIPSEEAQRAFERYMTFLKLVDRDDFWMAGQEVRELEWKWINGKTELLTGDMRDDYVQGVLTNGMLYRTEIPSNVNHFVCQLHELLSLGEGCLLINNTEALNFYDARNWCVKNGGDLPVIDSPDVLSIFREIVFRMRNAANVWVGLRKQWWTWKNTDSMLEMKYTNWLPNHGFKSNQTCMLAEMKGYKWQQESCSSKKLYVCQTVVTTPLNVISNPFTILTPMSAIVYAALGTFILVVPVIIAVIVTKQRKAKQLQCDARRAPSDRSYQDLHDRQDNQYTELHQKTERTPNYQNLSDYDDTVVTRVPNYLDIIE